jgi:hypoxanthine phosphoribosyltransferase
MLAYSKKSDILNRVIHKYVCTIESPTRGDEIREDEMPIKSSESLRPFIDETDIQTRIEGMVREIAAGMPGGEMVLVGILKKSFVFHADLIRRFHAQGVSLLIDFLLLPLDESKLFSSGKLTIEQDITEDLAGKRVLFVDDIIDTGHTAAAVHEHLKAKSPLSLKSCVFLDKLKKREVDFHPDHVGFTIPDVFIVGYGLGYNHRCRELPSLSVAAFEEIDKPLGFSIKNDRVFLNGKLDAAGADYVRETLLHWNGHLHLDLGDLYDVSAEGLDLLKSALQQVKQTGHDLFLHNVKPELRGTIRLGGFDQILPS